MRAPPTFTYKDKPTTVQEVGRQIGVRYVLEDSVRKASNQVRITAQLADAENGAELWAQSYDRPFRDVFITQDEIVNKILTTLQLQLSLLQSGVPRSSFSHGTDNVEAYDYYLRSQAPSWSRTKAGLAKSQEMLERAISLDPKYVDAYSSLGIVYLEDMDYSDAPLSDLQRADELARKAIAIDETDPGALALQSEVSLYKGN